MLESMKMKKKKEVVDEYEEILTLFKELVADVTARNNQMFGVSGQLKPEPE
jgi:hypothetical protein